ncbi:hypothetical protein ACS0TY_035172 [Phlomoides rotata]
MKMKLEKPLIFLYIILLAFFSSLPSTIAVPSSRSLKFISVENTSNQHLYHEFQEKRERMIIEVADYSGTGANNHHDPRAPPGSY